MSGEEDKGGAGGITITTPDGDKVLNVDEVQNLVSQNAELTKNVAGMANVSKALERYGTDADTYLSNAEAAFGVMSDLTSKGLIDERGNVLEGKNKDVDGETKNQNQDFDFSADFSQGDKEKTNRTLEIVSKVVETHLGGIKKQIDDLNTGQAGLYRAQVKNAIQTKHPTFSDEDVSKLIGTASVNPGKDLWTHADEMAEGKKASNTSDREKFAKEFGVDLKVFDENKLNEQNADGGSITVFPEKKFVFGKRAKRLGDKDSVSPRDALVAHMKANAKTG